MVPALPPAAVLAPPARCPGGSPAVVLPTVMLPLELGQGALPALRLREYVGSVRLHAMVNPWADGWLRAGAGVAASAIGGRRNVVAGPRAEVRLVGGTVAPVWVAGEYLAPLAGGRTYGAAAFTELARALRVVLRAHRVPARDAWFFELGAGVDLRYVVGGYVPRTTPAPPPLAGTITFFDLVRSESAVASAPLATPDSAAVRDAVSRRLAAMRRQPGVASLVGLLRQAGLGQVAEWMTTALGRARDGAASNRPPIAEPVPNADASRGLVRALVDGVEQNLCANG